MLKVLVIAGIGILTSCATCKERKAEKLAEKVKVEETIQDKPIVESEGRPMREEDLIDIEGTVRLNHEGCTVLIEMINGDLYSQVYPINLPEEYKIEGKKIVFTYLESKAPMVTGCKAEKAIVINEIKEK